jgi:tRNA (mo5U34)-methyltransferase
VVKAAYHHELVDLAARTDFVWHQRFELAPGIVTPGVSDVSFLMSIAGVPDDLHGASALDIGTTNGGAAFELERRGAARVVAVDVTDDEHFGFRVIRDTLRSDVEFRTLSVYELAGALQEQFDIVLFWGVLYHLRHPLLALDNVRAVTRERAYVETAVCDHETALATSLPLARFYRLGELGSDTSNWFAPNVAALIDWCRSCGFDAEDVNSWPPQSPSRAMVNLRAQAGKPEYQRVSYERPLACTVAAEPAASNPWKI